MSQVVVWFILELTGSVLYGQYDFQFPVMAATRDEILTTEANTEITRPAANSIYTVASALAIDHCSLRLRVSNLTDL